MRVIFGTVAIGMGLDVPNIRQVVHIGPPSTIKGYFQETGRAGRDGKPAVASLFYTNRDISKARVGMQDDMRQFCSSVDVCLRKLLLKSLDYQQELHIKPLHLCCGFCKEHCEFSTACNLLIEKL